MCQIIVKQKGKSLKDVNLELIERMNPDGLGIAVIKKDGSVFVDKTMNSSKELREKYGNAINLDMVIHYRIGTGASEITKENCHPFSFNHNLRNNLKFVSRENLLFHNGIVSNYEGNGEVDTYNLVQYALAKNENFKSILGLYGNSNRFALIENGKIERFGRWIEKDGIFYANNMGVGYFSKSGKIKGVRNIWL